MSLREEGPPLFAYVTFVQASDTTCKRGCFQKSIVLFSSFSYSTLFIHLSKIIAHQAFSNGLSNLEDVVLEMTIRHIASWYESAYTWAKVPQYSSFSFRPKPTPGSILELPFFGQLLSSAISSATMSFDTKSHVKAIYLCPQWTIAQLADPRVPFFTPLHTHPLTYSLIHSPAHSLAHLLIRPFTMGSV